MVEMVGQADWDREEDRIHDLLEGLHLAPSYEPEGLSYGVLTVARAIVRDPKCWARTQLELERLGTVLWEAYNTSVTECSHNPGRTLRPQHLPVFRPLSKQNVPSGFVPPHTQCKTCMERRDRLAPGDIVKLALLTGAIVTFCVCYWAAKTSY